VLRTDSKVGDPNLCRPLAIGRSGSTFTCSAVEFVKKTLHFVRINLRFISGVHCVLEILAQKTPGFSVLMRAVQ
jgi:hypothetical protein